MELFKRSLKSVLKLIIPKKHRIFIRWYYGHYGLVSTVVEYTKLLVKKPFTDVLTIQLNVPGSQTKVLLRPFEPDPETFEFVFLDHDYEMDCESAKYIIDAGANIGLASVYFATRFPETKIISIEPDDSNYELLVSNTAAFPNIQTIKGALWGENEALAIEDTEERSWGYRVKNSNGAGNIDGMTIEDLMDKLGADYIDILKLSIMGSEIEVFKSSGPWIDNINNIVVELYDWVRPGCTEAMEEAIRGRSFKRTERVHNIVLSNQKTVE